MIGLNEIFSLQLLPFLFAAWVVWFVSTAVYRLFFSPVAGFPGPKLAALSDLYEFYYDVFPHAGRYTWKIAELHEIYGPIIRITPWELHVSDPEYYDILYSATKKRDKWERTVGVLSMGGDGFATMDHNLHHLRRQAIGSYFSTANIRRLQPVVKDKVRICIDRLRDLAKTGEVVRLTPITSAYSSDVIMQYCFGRSDGRLEQPDFQAEAYDALHHQLQAFWVLKHIRIILTTVKALPEWLVMRLGGSLAQVVKNNIKMRVQIEETVRELDEEKAGGEIGEKAHRTIFHELLQSDLPAQEKSVKRLSGEAQVIMGAAGETIAWTLTVITYHLLPNPDTLKKLKDELQAAFPDPDDIVLVKLEALSYLKAIIMEGVRLSYGVASRMQRVPWEPLIFKTANKEWVIPAGTPVGMSSALLHHIEDNFPESHSFIPDRWIEDLSIERYMVSFCKGSRGCLGMNLAYAEMFLWLGNVFRRFGSKEVRFPRDEGIIELVDTDIEDVKLAVDYYVPGVKASSKGVKVRFSL